ncbi:hypothetical protein BV20DRAFT_959250 [Pilatotrama ljubarskyi]|nr:hypothetical protein BV20DRAFT_959250 [Pilatotrama ljubarskyi]
MPASMLVWAITPVMLLFVLVALIISSPSHAFYYLYSSTIPLKATHPHVIHTANSVREATGLVLCAFEYVAPFPFVCASGHSSTMTSEAIRDLRCERLGTLLSRRTELFDGLVQGLTLIAPAVRLASLDAVVGDIIMQDDLTMLYEDGGPEVLGVGDIRLLRRLRKLCVSLGHASAELASHANLTMMRILFVNSAMMGRLQLQQLGADIGLGHRDTFVDVGSFVALSANATASSIRYTRAEVRHVAEIATALVAALGQLAARNDFGRLCPSSSTALLPVCEPFANVLRAFHDALAVLEALRNLDVLLDEILYDVVPFGFSRAASVACPVPMSMTLVTRDTKSISRTLREMSKVQKATAPGTLE